MGRYGGRSTWGLLGGTEGASSSRVALSGLESQEPRLRQRVGPESQPSEAHSARIQGGSGGRRGGEREGTLSPAGSVLQGERRVGADLGSLGSLKEGNR